MGVKEDPRTTYAVLHEGDDGRWLKVGVIMATSAENAIKNAVKESGTYVAVPARSWKPMRVEQVQTVQITAADEVEPAPANDAKDAYPDAVSS